MIDSATRTRVRRRASDRCEYCTIHQEDEPFFRYQVEHIIPRKHNGADGLDNLALACPPCNLHKGSNIAGIDPEAGAIVPLFHPRRDQWKEHFRMEQGWIIGRTPVGRATLEVLQRNRAFRVEIRRASHERLPL